MTDYLTLGLKLLLAALCGGVVGYQRERHDRPAGLRTHILVCLGSAVFALVSFSRAFAATGPDTRIAAQVVTGVGFLGAGTILHLGGSVIGLTTAASLWAVAAIGLAVGTGDYALALTGTLLVWVVLAGVSRLEHMRFARGTVDLSMYVQDRQEALRALESVCHQLGCTLERVTVTAGQGADGQVVAALRLLKGQDPAEVAGRLAATPGVKDIGVS